MRNAPMLLSGLLLLSVGLCGVVFGHIPVIVKTESSKEEPVAIRRPEISYAYYGLLDGEPHYYRIDSGQPFSLYVNILVPDYEPQSPAVPHQDMSVEVWKDNILLFEADGLRFDWRRFYEKYGRDHYYMGPEYEQRADPGTYRIKVFNASQRGKYALAVGKKERFTPWGLVGAMFKAWSLDKWFFRR